MHIFGDDVDALHPGMMFPEPVAERQRGAVGTIAIVDARRDHLHELGRKSGSFQAAGADTGGGVVIVGIATHPDHWPATRRLADATGAEVLAFGKRIDKDADVAVDRALTDGDTIEGTEFGLEVLHTPGHAPNHLCFLLEEERVLFTGDTVLAGMYSVVNPARGGDMAVYLATLQRLERLRLTRICPGHGDVIDEPRATIQDYVAHRHERERQVLRQLKSGPKRIADMVTALYGDQDLPPKLVEAAGWQVHAHLLRLKADGKVAGTSVKSSWQLA